MESNCLHINYINNIINNIINRFGQELHRIQLFT